MYHFANSIIFRKFIASKPRLFFNSSISEALKNRTNTTRDRRSTISSIIARNIRISKLALTPYPSNNSSTNSTIHTISYSLSVSRPRTYSSSLSLLLATTCLTGCFTLNLNPVRITGSGELVAFVTAGESAGVSYVTPPVVVCPSVTSSNLRLNSS